LLRSARQRRQMLAPRKLARHIGQASIASRVQIEQQIAQLGIVTLIGSGGRIGDRRD
jgi:hypothetical protein